MSQNKTHNNNFDLKKSAQGWYKKFQAYRFRHPVLFTALVALLYLLVFQRDFLFSGDTWAEAFVEHLHDALSHDWGHVISPSWIGYVFFLPSFFAKLYVSMHWPLGYIDLFYRLIVIIYTILSVAVVAHPLHRSVIKSDNVRLAFALGCLLLLHDVSSFSFINVWYIGFVPLIFYGLSNASATTRQQIGYVLGGVMVSLTKPSTAIAPFLVYRMIRTKEYVSNGIVLLAVAVQTWLLYRADAQGTVTLVSEVKRLLFIGGIELFKLFHLPVPSLFFVAVADLLLMGGLVFIWRKYNALVAGMIAFGLLLSLHAYYIAAGTSMFIQGKRDLALIYNCNLKQQQEVMINIFYLLIGTLVAIPTYERGIKLLVARAPKFKSYGYAGAAIIVVVLLGAIYEPIDRGKSVDIAAFRYDLTVGQPVCIPMPTLDQGEPNVNWYFSYSGNCGVANAFSIPNMNRFTASLNGRGQGITVAGWPGQRLRSVLLLVKTPHQKSALIKMVDTNTGTPYYAPSHRLKNGISYAAFNVSGVSMANSYGFRVTSSSQQATICSFTDHESLAYYPYFMED